MESSEVTCWTIIRDAARGVRVAREEFTRRYLPVVRATLRARWRGRPLEREIDDVVQEVFVDCFRPDGALARVEQDKGSGFRGFLYGVVRNLALRAESARGRARERVSDEDLDALVARGDPLSVAFDREWARALVGEARRLHEELAAVRGAAAVRRMELLRLRFEDGLSMRAIAERWGVESDWLHHQYARARSDFRQCLRQVVAFHHLRPSAARLDAECERVLALLAAT